jgi:hypothetical protein
VKIKKLAEHRNENKSKKFVPLNKKGGLEKFFCQDFNKIAKLRKA